MKTRAAVAALALLAAPGVLVAGGGVVRPAAAQATMNHAAVVIDTGDGKVRKLCLAFPEAEIDGIEALRRVDTRPSRFEAYGTKGTAVCMLCGVGCPSGACFCDPEKFWAYHRAGPGEDTYQTSRVGASSTVVRDGDVEAWKWGAGGSPVKVTVSEVCGVEEPPRRTASDNPTSTTSTTAPSQPSQTTLPAPTSVPPPPVQPGAPLTSAPIGPPPAQPPPTTIPEATSSGIEAPPGSQAEQDAAVPSGGGGRAPASLPQEKDGSGEGGSAGDRVTAAAFVALLGGVLVWRARLRRAKVRRERPVR